MIVEQGQAMRFTLKEVSFAELKTLRDACREYTKQGSAQSEKLYQTIEAFISAQTV